METACATAPRFSPGMIVATAGVQALIESISFQPLTYLLRHLHGD